MSIAISNGGTGVTAHIANTGISNATWSSGIEGIQAENLIKPQYELYKYHKARGFNSVDEYFEHFESVAKLTNADVVELIKADLAEWRKK
jgi:DNA-binding transcriptional regulator GbsR (MarR family)